MIFFYLVEISPNFVGSAVTRGMIGFEKTQDPLINKQKISSKSGPKTILALRQVRPWDKSWFETSPALRQVQPKCAWTILSRDIFDTSQPLLLSFWTVLAPKFLDKSGPRQVWPWDKSGPETSPAPRQVRPRDKSSS